MGSPFLQIPECDWIAGNVVAFAVRDGFPVSAGHSLVITRRLIATWFDATPEEQAGLMALVNEVKAKLDVSLSPRPDGYNVGFNAGEAAGQTVPHLHIHVIPRYRGDVPDPRGGVRGVIPSKGNYLAAKQASPLSRGHPGDSLWERLEAQLYGAREVDVVSAFVQLSGLDVLEKRLFGALQEGATIRLLVGDYLYISDPQALRRLHGWMEVSAEKFGVGRFQSRLVELARLPGAPASFHPKAWRIANEAGGMVVVGSSNLSRPALLTGVEWNLLVPTGGAEAALESSTRQAFQALWDMATPLTAQVVESYAAAALSARRTLIEPESIDAVPAFPSERPWQVRALASLEAIRAQGHRRALVAVATGLGKTWLAAFDLLQFGAALGRRPRVLVVAHRAEILAQVESVFRRAMNEIWPETRVSWFVGATGDLSGDLVIASIQKLSRPESIEQLKASRFDYVTMDEVHHAQAPSYQRVLAYLTAEFTLGLTATPERTDGVDVVSLFDDILAHQAGIGDGIEEGSLIPFHYIGLKDDIDFAQIPWRNGRFELEVLEQRVESSARMERLWKVWKSEPAQRTLVFCCSKRHALFTRDWLRAHGVSAAAVFSGSGGDLRSESVRDFRAGHLAALCAVDLFNEGVDLPSVDRVVMLRPTESKIVFMQQIGRGLRAAEGKTRLLVIDFVGNHRVFARRLIHLLSLNRPDVGWRGLRNWLDGGPADVPPGCLLDVEIEAKDVLRRVLPTGGAAAVEAYRAMRDELGRRPSISELFQRGYLPATIRAQHHSWFEFVRSEGDLSEAEAEVAETFLRWFRMLETTALTKCYKMVVLEVLLNRGDLWSGCTVRELAEACRRHLLNHATLNQDLTPNAQIPDHRSAPAEVWAAWWSDWPLGRWLDVQDGQRWFRQDEGVFRIGLECRDSLRADFEAMTRDVVEFRLAQYVKGRRLAGGTIGVAVGGNFEFVAKVSHAGGKPILFLPTLEELPERPVGPIEIRLPDGTEWVFKLVRIACNVAHPRGTNRNQLGTLLRTWFGPDAGLPGTGFHVRFSCVDGAWSIAPEGEARGGASAPATDGTSVPPFRIIPGLSHTPPESEKFVRWVPVYDLQAAAGLWGPDQVPQEIGWKALADRRLAEGMFLAWVTGKSMEPKIPSGSWCLFRKCPAGTRNGRILLVQFHSMADPEDGGRYTVKKYHSEKTVTEEGWRHERVQLQSLNRDFKPIEVTAAEASEMVVVGEFVAVVE